MLAKSGCIHVKKQYLYGLAKSYEPKKKLFYVF